VTEGKNVRGKNVLLALSTLDFESDIALHDYRNKTASLS